MSRSGGTNGPGKARWPELVGVPATPAVARISHDRPDVAVVVLPDGTLTSNEFNTERVRVFFDAEHLVARTPIVG